MNIVHLKYPYQLEKKDPSTSYSLAVGFFDGVHRGHQTVIHSAIEKANALNVKSAVMTFDPHPSIVLGKSNEKIFYITTLSQKLEILEEMGIDTTFVVQFTSDFAKLAPEDFIQYFIRDFNVKHVTAGFDFSFGAFGKGDMSLMKELSHGDFGVTVIDPQMEDGVKISSTLIRKKLQDGNMEAVHHLLGRPYQIPGIVVQGDKRGRTIGFPTANILSKEGCFIPAIGVYAVKILVQNKLYDGVCNVGYKPTFKNPEEKQLTIEVHILDFEKNIYGEEVKVYWYKRLRDEQKFDGIESLKAQISRDKARTIEYFSSK